MILSVVGLHIAMRMNKGAKEKNFLSNSIKVVRKKEKAKGPVLPRIYPFLFRAKLYMYSSE